MKHPICKILASLLAASLLTACSSPLPPPEKQLYLLDSVPSQSEETSPNFIVDVRVVSLPNYLNQSALVMMTGTHQMQVATNHAWADRLGDSIERVIRHEYAKALQQVNDQESCTERCQILLTIEHFYPSSNGDVFLVGYYELTTGGAGSVIQNFNIKGKIQSDGYLGAVEEMRSLLLVLTQQISEKS